MSFFIGKEIEVAFIDQNQKQVGIIIHLYHTVNESYAEIYRKYINSITQFSVKYLIDEGFIDNPNDWSVKFGGVFHTST